MLVTVLKVVDVMITIALVGFVVYDCITIDKMKHLIKQQQGLIELQDLMLKLSLNCDCDKNCEQVKCCGSTSDSKPAGEGSTPSTCAKIYGELSK